MTAQYHSKVCAIAHNAMEQLFTAGLIEAERMFEFDLLCRTDVAPDAQFAALRNKAALPKPQISRPERTIG
jgi:DNA-binding transcriptional regulator YiaG